MIEKTLQTMLPSDRILQHQYRAKNYQTYSDLIHDLLQTEKHDELTMKNHHQRPVGAAPLPEVHHNVKGKNKFEGTKKPPMNSGNFKKHRRNRKKNGQNVQALGKSVSNQKSDKCHKCGCFNHSTKKCRTPRHLVELYQKSLEKVTKLEEDMKHTSTFHLPKKRLLVRFKFQQNQVATCLH